MNETPTQQQYCEQENVVIASDITKRTQIFENGSTDDEFPFFVPKAKILSREKIGNLNIMLGFDNNPDGGKGQIRHFYSIYCYPGVSSVFVMCLL